MVGDRQRTTAMLTLGGMMSGFVIQRRACVQHNDLVVFIGFRAPRVLSAGVKKMKDSLIVLRQTTSIETSDGR